MRGMNRLAGVKCSLNLKGAYHDKPNRAMGFNILCDYTNRLLFIPGVTRSY